MFSSIASATKELPSVDVTPRVISKSSLKWLSADRKVFFNKESLGWSAWGEEPELGAAMEAYGLTRLNPPIFPTLQETRQVVLDVALQEGLSLSPRLKRFGGSMYQVGDLPLNVYSSLTSTWRIGLRYDQQLPEKITPYFPEGLSEFHEILAESGIHEGHYLTRAQATLVVKDWLQDHMQGFNELSAS